MRETKAERSARSAHHPETLERYVMNNRTTHETIQRHVSAIVSAIGLAADQLTRENKNWHDDPQAEDHALFHSPSEVQFPADMRLVVAAECMLYFLRETPAGIKICNKLALV